MNPPPEWITESNPATPTENQGFKTAKVLDPFSFAQNLHYFHDNKTDWFNPFIEAEDEWMEGIDRDELKLEKEYFHWLNR